MNGEIRMGHWIGADGILLFYKKKEGSKGVTLPTKGRLYNKLPKL